LQRRRVKQDLDPLGVRVRAHLPHTCERFEQALDALFTALTVEPLITDDFKCDGLQHTTLLPCMRGADRARLFDRALRGKAPLAVLMPARWLGSAAHAQPS